MRFDKTNLEEIMKLMKTHGVKEVMYKSLFKSLTIKMEGEQELLSSNYEIVKQKIEKPLEETKVKDEIKEQEDKEDAVTKKEKEKYHEIKAPLVGTFYRSPAPDADPFVEKGDKIKVGDTLCIVEAMKNMNEIESDVEGIVKDICVQNAEMVEYGQVLFKIELEKE
jgi:acetyl-CoA carboxylase biotin carboxyl carrier protein